MFSTVTSAFFSSSRTISSPRGDLRFSVIDFLLALNWWKYQGSSSGWPRRSRRPGSPSPGFSILTTSAPSQASDSVQDGPASNWVKSTTRTPARQSSSTPISAISRPSLEEVLLRDHADEQYERHDAKHQTNPQSDPAAIHRAKAEDREQRGERHRREHRQTKHRVALNRFAGDDSGHDDQHHQRRIDDEHRPGGDAEPAHACSPS